MAGQYQKCEPWSLGRVYRFACPEHTARNYASEALAAAVAAVAVFVFVPSSFSKLALLALEYEVAILVIVSGSLERKTKTPVSAFRTPQSPHLINKKSGDACSKEPGNNVARGRHTRRILQKGKYPSPPGLTWFPESVRLGTVLPFR